MAMVERVVDSEGVSVVKARSSLAGCRPRIGLLLSAAGSAVHVVRSLPLEAAGSSVSGISFGLRRKVLLLKCGC